jgi:hypothetical protein
MTTSNVSIANGALQRLGASRIESLTQDKPNARSMNAAFARVRDSLIRQYDWAFAIKRESIAADGTAPTWGDYNRYAVPNDYLRVLRDDETGVNVDWKLEGGFIVTKDAAPLEIRYIARIEDPNLFDALFVEVFELKLAVATCKEITGSNSQKADLYNELGNALAEARKWGSIEKGPKEANEDEWLLARL